MDTSEYMPMFLAETREHLEHLNLAIVRLEKNPKDQPTVDEIFRIAHSLKGMSATMGFAKIAELTHAMEDVFELLRQRTSGIKTEAIDTVFACLDALSGAVEAIEADGQEALDPEPLVKRLRTLVRPRTREQQLARVGSVMPPDHIAIDAALAAGARVLHVRVTLHDETLMPAVRAHMVFSALTEHGEIVGSAPAPDGLELFDGRRIDAWIATDNEQDVVADAARAISEVATVEVGALDPEELAKQAAPAPEPQAPAPVAAAADAPTAHRATRTVRVDAERLDTLMHLMGELVIHRTAVDALTTGLDVPGLQQAVQELTRSSHALQEMVMQVRMIPVDIVFLRFPRLVRDLASKTGKEVKLELIGSDTELDRTVVDAIGDPLVHLVRNAVDHGLETTEQRMAAGKPSHGTISLIASQAGGSVIIEVRDDGRGLDAAAIGRKAASLGLIDEHAANEIDLRSAIELLFAPGFSTSETTNDISGRGVGMDAVRAKIRQLGGEVVIDSTPGVGTTAQIRLPLTLAIVSALHVEVAGAPFAIPIDRIERTLRLSQETVRSVAGRRMLVLGDDVLPLADGAQAFGRAPTGDHEFAVVIRAQDRRLALTVDDLVGQRELVTRPLPAIVADEHPVSGGASLPDARIALIVDCDALLNAALAGATPAAATVTDPELRLAA
ncbi:MAG TPA: chemotaxis protein CheA [Solirubrobacteraceae bacterium]|jgi:two-component system chemotaxis sensor kinase CheA